MTTPPVTREIEARFRQIWYDTVAANDANGLKLEQEDEAIQCMMIAYSLDRASGDGVRAALVTATSDNTLYYLRSIYRQFKEFKDHFNSEAMQRVEDVNPGPSIGSEVLADNADWLDCHIDWLERTARAALSAVSIPRGEVVLTNDFLDNLDKAYHRERHTLRGISGVEQHRGAMRVVATLVREGYPLPPAGGWRLVPVEPTPEMTHQATLCTVRENGGIEFSINEVYRKMVRAAPARPASDKETT